MKVDLHVHSKYSTRPSQWILQKINCPESFSEPLQIYEKAKSSGMSLVTISDHNSINGALEIAHLPDAFISEEITTYFPENQCKIHVLAFDIDEKKHSEIQTCRENIYELVEYLNANHIAHSVAHSLYAINDRLTIDLFEKLLLLFKNFEINGARGKNQNGNLRHILSILTPHLINTLEEKHGLECSLSEPWKKNLTGGSDDHSALNIAGKYTEVPGASNLKEFLDGINKNLSKVHGKDSKPETLAHNLYGIAYQFYKQKFNVAQHSKKDPLLRFFDRFLSPDHQHEEDLLDKLYYIWNYRKRYKQISPDSSSIQDVVKRETHKLIQNDTELSKIYKKGISNIEDIDLKWFEFVNKVSNKVLMHFGNHLFDNLSGVNLFNIFNAVGSAGALYSVLAPYFVSYSLFARDRALSQKALEDVFANTNPVQGRKVANVAHFTDTFYDVNGVALTLQQQVKTAARVGKKYKLITCDLSRHEKDDGIKYFQPTGVAELPVYRQLKLLYPPLLEMLDYCYINNFTHIHSSTPGPIGLAALLIARILKLPINATYHTSLPQYARYLTGDDTIEDLTWKYVLWYYNQMDLIFVPSASTGKELINKGIPADKIQFFPRGIDITRFNPSRHSPHTKSQFNLGKHPRLLYVGRVSKEKNLELLVRIFTKITDQFKEASLTIVGDGPYLEEMKSQLRETPTVFTGYVEGDNLAKLYAASDLFVFPSTTDTFGNVVLEAQASGLPVIVTDSGGPQENLIPGKTGLVVPSDNENEFFEAITALLTSEDRRREMGINARRYMEERAFDKAFVKTWKIYEDQLPRPRPQPHMAQAV